MISFFVDGDKIIYSEDGWNTIISTKEKVVGNEYKYSELGKNVRTRIKFYKKYPLYYQTIINDLEYINVLLRNEYDRLNKVDPDNYNLNKAELDDDGYGHAYEVFSLSTILNKPFQKIIEENNTIGEQDGKIDGLFYDDKNSTINFYQIKIMNMDASDFSDFIKNADLIMHEKKVRDGHHLNLQINKSKIDFSKPLDKKLFLICDDASSENKDVEFISGESIITNYINSRLTVRNNNFLNMILRIDKTDISICNDDYFIFYPAKKLISDIMELTKQQKSVFDSLFMDNVRRAVKKSEEKFMKVLLIPEERAKFHLYNNGISICGDVDCRSNGTVIVNPMVINGQQTLRALYNIFLKDSSLLDDTVFVPLFIKNVAVDDVNLRHNIAKYNNTQNKIEDNDFMSIDINARKMQQNLLSSHNIYLDIISNGTDSIKELAKDIYIGRIVMISDFVRLALAIDDSSKLGTYKNRQNFAVEITSPLLEKYQQLEFDCVKICEAIIEYNNFISKNNLKKYLACNLLIEYELYKGKKLKEIIKYVDFIDRHIAKYNINDGDIIKSMKSKDFIAKLDLEKMRLK